MSPARAARLRRAFEAERSVAALRERTSQRWARLEAAAADAPRYRGAIGPPRAAGIAGDDFVPGLGAYPISNRDLLAARQSDFLASRATRCYLAATSGTTGPVAHVAKPSESLPERQAINQRFFSSLGLPPCFTVVLVSESTLPFRTTTFYDWRLRYRHRTLDAAIKRAGAGIAMGDLIVSAPRTAKALVSAPMARRDRLATSFEFGPRAYRRFGLEASHLAEGESEIYSAAEFSAPIAFRFPGCPSLHINCDAIWVETLDVSTNSPLADGHHGRIVVTDLLNTTMPLVRYALGDIGSLSWAPCACGRVTPRLELVARERLVDPNARRLFRQIADLGSPALVLEPEHGSLLVYADPEPVLQGILHRPPAGLSIELRPLSELPSELGSFASARVGLSLAERPAPSSSRRQSTLQLTTLARRLRVQAAGSTFTVRVMDSGSMRPLIAGECRATCLAVSRSDEIKPGDLIIFDAAPLDLLVIHRCLEVSEGMVLVYPDRVRPDTRHSTNPWVEHQHVLGIVDSIATATGGLIYRRGSTSGRAYDRLALMLGRLSWDAERSGLPVMEAVLNWTAPVVLRASLTLGGSNGHTIPTGRPRIRTLRRWDLRRPAER